MVGLTVVVMVVVVVVVEAEVTAADDRSFQECQILKYRELSPVPAAPGTTTDRGLLRPCPPFYL